MTHDTIYIKLFGEFSVWVNGQPVPLDNCTTKAMRVLQFLLFRYPAGVSRNTLMDAFFVDDSTSDPANNLNVTISQLRRRLKKAALPGEVGVQLKSNQYTLTCSVPIHSDVTRFEECMAQAGQTTDADQRLELLLEAEQLYSGDFLPHLAMDDWAVTTAAKYRMDYFACLDALTQLLPERGEWEQLLGIATRASSMHPLEEFFCLRIDCLMNLERYQEAKQVYDQAIRTLTEDFVVKPSAELTRRFQLLSLANQDSHETIFELNNQLREAEHQRGPTIAATPASSTYTACAAA
ncbi:BTAD domain-containing putative transcriptional regulator [Fournierella sp.]|uniref:AfsR/SARP family transcriptional regulator n=1 Tax=Allofournierella sp. TaxID=1940256 RepID=UPI0025C2C999|nr:BTAD domain-containing putative transcriptional regulator [Fournierella sp.]